MEELVGEKIVTVKIKNLGNSSMASSMVSTHSKMQKLKWSPYDKEISEEVCQEFLKVVTPDSSDIEPIF